MRQRLSFFGLVLLGACAHPGTTVLGLPGPVPSTPATPVALEPPTVRPTPTPSEDLRRTLETHQGPLGLADVIDFALQNHPATRASWLAARSAAAALGSKRSAYFPKLDGGATLTRSSVSALGGRYVIDQTTYGPSATLSLLLLDFGGRGAAVDEARAALDAADWSHNAAITQVVLTVETSYYGYLSALAQRDAAEVSLHEAETSLQAAEHRLGAGLATKLEVLQARTARSQARLALAQLSGQLASLKGALAVSLGLSADTPLELEKLPTELPVDSVHESVTALMQRALRERPDLAAARALAEKATRHVATVRSSGLPSLGVAAQASRSYYQPHPYARFGDSWSAGLVLTFPLFSGFSTPYDIAQAENDAAGAEAKVDALAQQVALDVWQSYYDLTSAGEALQSARDLVESASQAEQVAAGRYQQGVGDVLDLLTAQATLASARAQEIAARSGWLIALARLAYSVGASDLAQGPSHEAP